VPAAARVVFGDRLPSALRYAAWLAGEGTARGLIGPRERDRLWQRHLLNSAVVGELIPTESRVVDVGAGAGLPGIPLALSRPDLRIDLVEPMQRRVTFLAEVVDDLELASRVRLVHGRAEDAAVVAAVGDTSYVVARAVAPLDRLVRWCFPLLSPRGRLLALKGETAESEVKRHRAALRRHGAASIEVERVGSAVLLEPTRVVVVSRAGQPAETRDGA
jgi:16S rRNA (guanine527-N7)-methyltransferase